MRTPMLRFLSWLVYVNNAVWDAKRSPTGTPEGTSCVGDHIYWAVRCLPPASVVLAPVSVRLLLC